MWPDSKTFSTFLTNRPMTADSTNTSASTTTDVIITEAGQLRLGGSRGSWIELSYVRFAPFCYLTAIVDGQPKRFKTSRQKFEHLAISWQEYNSGQSVIDYSDFAFEQIVGMGVAVVPLLLERVASGESEWIYALKCISGVQAETTEMQGDEDQVVQAWIQWGRNNAKPAISGQTCEYERLDTVAVPPTEGR
jgi:hypothetical protein